MKKSFTDPICLCDLRAFLAWAEKWKPPEGNCCCTNHPDLAHLRTKADDARLAAEEPKQPPRIIRFSGWKIIRCPLTEPQASKLKDSARCLIERRAEPSVA